MKQDPLFEKIANALVEDGYIILQDALSEKLSLNLLSFAKEANNYKKAGISNTKNFQIDISKRRDKTKWLDEDNSVQSEYLLFMKDLQTYLNRSLYLGLVYYESHFAIYEEGDFYEKHLDAFQNSKNRIVTTVYYLNEEWSNKDKGELIIYDKKSTQLQKIKPEANTLVIFMSEDFPHEVLKTSKKRYSIAGWFRVDKK